MPVTSIQSTFIGFYLAVALRCSVILFKRYRSKRARPAYLLFTHIALFLLVNIRCLTVIVRALVALFKEAPDGTIAETPIWSSQSLLVNSTLFLIIFLSDTFICYRTYIVWSKNVKIVILPVLLLMGDLALMIYEVKTMSDADIPNDFNTLSHATEYLMIFTLILNALNTGLISYRIWTVRRRSAAARHGKDMLANFASILVESAAVYSALLIVHIVLLSMDSFLIFVFIDTQSPIIGIVFSSIIISVTQGSAFGDTPEESNSIPSTYRSSSEHRDWRSTIKSACPPSHPSRVEIKMSRVVNTYRGSHQWDSRQSSIVATIDAMASDVEVGMCK
ncbi:hypothetical protein BT96DRAFT_1000946 [Gymnopus androsaceus JB14]|uniref:Uncharacterized protein n=1 Tax=Gymnopus androsaceus JB14 TaxID=1447944 RepID=A0A6A4H3V0_9AGAR|nr:hypothetical protein BT96DRAFT_1000946 [Gymnopus androsaceus JB14]